MRPNPISLFSRVQLICLAAICCLALSVQARPQFHLPLNEGSGTNLTDSIGGLNAQFGLYLDPVGDLASIAIDNSPSGLAGDNSLQTQNTGYLIADDSTNKVLNITHGPITMEAWVFLTGPSPGTTMWEGIARYGGSYKLGMRGRNLAFTLLGKADIFSGKIIPTNQWVHIAAVWNPGVGVTFYTNGVANSVVNVNTPARPVFDNYLTVAFEGPSSSATPRGLPGFLDRVRIHHTALSAGEIDSVAGSPKGIYGTTLVAYNFDQADLPAMNSASEILPARYAQEILSAWTSPTWTSDTPSGEPNDFALEFSALQNGGVTPQSATVLDPSNTITTNGTNGDYTMEAWIRVPTNFPNINRRTIFQHLGTPAFTFSLEADRTLFTAVLGKVQQNSSAVVTNDNAWHHVAVVHQDGVQFRFYVDGVLRDTRSYTQGPASGPLPWFLIGSGFNGSLPFIGKMDRLRFSNRALAPGEFDFASLSINRINNDVVITWPAGFPGFLLEGTTKLTLPQWVTVPHQEINGINTAIVQPSGTNTFYRLRK